MTNDLSGRLLALNDAARSLTGYDRSAFPTRRNGTGVLSGRLLRQFTSGAGGDSPK